MDCEAGGGRGRARVGGARDPGGSRGSTAVRGLEVLEGLRPGPESAGGGPADDVRPVWGLSDRVWRRRGEIGRSRGRPSRVVRIVPGPGPNLGRVVFAWHA